MRNPALLGVVALTPIVALRSYANMTGCGLTAKLILLHSPSAIAGKLGQDRLRLGRSPV
jgi:hypothetical protein